MRFRLSKPTPAFVVAVTALFVALGGTSYAVSQIGTLDITDNSVLSRDVRDGTIRSVDIKDGSVYSSDVANGSLKGQDFAPGTLLKGDKGAKGDTGAPGTNGTNGTNGAPGAQGVATRWALIDEFGNIVEASDNGFTVKSNYDQGLTPPNQNIYIDAGEDLSDNGIIVSIALQNRVDVDNADGDTEPNFAGEISASRCNLTTPLAVACAPMGTNTNTHFVVSPRNSDGTATAPGARKRFYVVITGDSSDFVPPVS